MKKWSYLVISTALLSASFNAFASEEEKDKQLVFMNWGPYISTELREQFTKETGIKVIYSTYESNETMYAKLRAHPEGYDLVVPSTYFFCENARQGYVAKNR